MSRLQEILAKWDAGPPAAAEVVELKQMLATREGRAELVDDWLLDEAIYHSLKAQPAEVSAPALETAAAPRRPQVLVRPRRPLLRWLVWHEVRISLRWSFGVAMAVCFAFVGVWFYFQKSAVGQLAAASPRVVVERAGQKLSAQAGQALYPGDVLCLPAGGTAAIAWAGETTRLDLAPDTDLQLLNPLRGKRLFLQRGVLDANVAPQSAWRPMTISTPQAIARVVGTHFSLVATSAVTRLDVLDGAVRLRKTRPGPQDAQNEVTVHAGETATAAPNIKFEVRPLNGLSKEIWAVPSGTALTDAATKGTLLSDSAAVGPNTVERLRGYIAAPESGDFTFWVGSLGGTRAVELWLSPDADPVRKRRIAYFLPTQSSAATPLPGTGRSANRPLDWHRAPSQQSSPQPLVAGRRYYVELWHEGTDMSPIGFGWQRPGQSPSSEPVMIDFRSLYPMPGTKNDEPGSK